MKINDNIFVRILVILNVIILLLTGLMYRNVGSVLNMIKNKMDIYEAKRQEEILVTQIESKERDIDIHKVLVDMLEIIENNTESIFILEKNYKNIQKVDLEEAKKIQEANFLIFNTTRGACGSGTNIKIDGLNYILTCGHLIDDVVNDNLMAIDDNGLWMPVTVVKYNKEKDLALLRFWSGSKYASLEMSEEFPEVGSEVIVIGNPSLLRDVITNGIIAKEDDRLYLLTNKSYFGNSGGAILYKSKIVGVMSVVITLNTPFTLYTTYAGAVKLETIQEFLRG